MWIVVSQSFICFLFCAEIKLYERKNAWNTIFKTRKKESKSKVKTPFSYTDSTADLIELSIITNWTCQKSYRLEKLYHIQTVQLISLSFPAVPTEHAKKIIGWKTVSPVLYISLSKWMFGWLPYSRTKPNNYNEYNKKIYFSMILKFHAKPSHYILRNAHRNV